MILSIPEKYWIKDSTTFYGFERSFKFFEIMTVPLIIYLINWTHIEAKRIIEQVEVIKWVIEWIPVKGKDRQCRVYRGRFHLKLFF